MFKLVIQDDEGKTTVVPLIRDEITIGRKEGNTIRLTERNVSRRHARILRNNNDVHIEDLGSYNGIRVNNARIAERVSLRVSDQVQIGDYKLYLKAEGVEQIDDARTMPIERIDMSAEPTAPVAAAAAVAAPAAAPVMVGNPNRTMVAMADTDPAGRAVAAPAVAAGKAAAAVGRMVVLSSNFAGTEFELVRPEMVIGRTEDNDIVLDHKSISRNHAKLTRDPETQRYTINDLQSANGVRVNGQDYGRVELRRGDVVDLGHVRLRFVEAGEDFVFARDAVVTDVPQTGGKKKGLVLGIAAAVLVGGAAVVVLGGGGDKKPAVVAGGEPPAGSGGAGPGSAGTQAAVVPDAAAAEVAPDATAMVATGPTEPANPGSGGGDDLSRKVTECRGLKAAKKWADLDQCSRDLGTAGGAAAMVTEFQTTAKKELSNELRVPELKKALASKDFAGARKILDTIDADSVYRTDAQALVEAKERALVDDFKARGTRLAKAGKCKDLQTLTTQAAAQSQEAADALHAMKCVEQAVAVTDGGGTTSAGSGTGKPPAGSGEPTEACDAAALEAKGKDLQNSGFHSQALTTYEAALRCKASYSTIRFAYMASCRAQNAQKAKQYYAKLNPTDQAKMLVICVSEHITPN